MYNIAPLAALVKWRCSWEWCFKSATCCCWGPGFQIVCFFLQGAWRSWYVLQLLLQAGAPVTNLHQATYLRPKCLSTTVGEFGRSPWSPCQPEGVEHVQNLTLVLEFSVWPGRLAECFPAVREDFLIDLSINTCFFCFCTSAFCLLLGLGKNLNLKLCPTEASHWINNSNSILVGILSGYRKLLCSHASSKRKCENGS